MFGPDPIDFASAAPYGFLPYYGHLLLGAIAMIAALLAFSTVKGGALHRRAGLTFAFACAIVCVTSVAMLVEVPIPPLMMAVFTCIYAIGGGYLALQRSTKGVRLAEYGLLALQLIGLAIFLSIAVPEAMNGAIPIIAPITIATIPVILIAGDVNWFLNQHRRRDLRLARHLNRMIWAFVVVLRAPLVEFAAGGFLPLFPPFYVLGPIVLGVLMVFYFQRKYGALKP